MTRSHIHLQIGWRLLLLTIIVACLQPAPILVAVGRRQTAQSKHPILAVHTRLTDEVEPWKIQRTLQLVREMGATTIVEYFPWAYYQGADGGIAWEHPDLVIEHAYAQGLTVIARISSTPGWARPPDTPLNYLDESAYADFATFSAQFAQRYRGKVSYLIAGQRAKFKF